MEKNDPSKHGIPLVVFSGGADSTAVLHEAMKRNSFVDTLYIKIPIAGYKFVMERARRLEIIKLLSEYTDSKVATDYFVDLTKSFHIDKFAPRDDYVNHGHEWAVDKLNFLQPPFWLFEAFVVADPERHSAVQLGYIKGDDASIITTQLQNLWAALWAVGRPDAKMVPLEFPLIRRSKSDVLKMISYTDKKLLNLVWFCEHPEARTDNSDEYNRGHLDSVAKPEHIRACGYCKPCITHAQAMFDPNTHDAVQKNSASSLDLLLKKHGDNIEVIKPEDEVKNNNGFVRYA